MTDYLRSIFAVTFKRLWAQRGLALATELGLITAVALTMLAPLYTDAVYFRILQTELADASANIKRPSFAYLYRYLGAWSGSVQWEQTQPVDTYLMGEGARALGVPLKKSINHFETDLFRLFPAENTTNYSELEGLGYFGFAVTSEIQNHIQITEGTFPEPAAPTTDSLIQVLVTQTAAEKLGLQVGNTFTAYNHRDADAVLREIPVQVAGIWKPLDASDDFWFVAPNSFDNILLIPLETFVHRLSPFMDDEVHYAVWYLLMDGSEVDTNDVSRLSAGAAFVYRRVDALLPKTTNLVSPLEAIKRYAESTARLTVLLTAFNIPAVGLTLLFIILIVGLTVEGRRNELAVMQSRGATRWQVIGFSALEGVILGVVAFIVGTILALALTFLLGKTRSFLDFSAPATLRLHLTNAGLRAGLLAIGLAIAAQIIATIAASGSTIVNYKQEQARETTKPFWQRIWLDVLLFIPAAYGFYILREQGTLLIGGDPLSASDPFQNPLLFLLPALFAFSLTLFFIRIFPWLMTAISRLLVYTDSVSVLLAVRQLARAPRFYFMPLILLVLTSSLAVFTASLALTLDLHLFDASLYNVGADVSISGAGLAYEPSSVFGIPVTSDEPKVQESNRAIFLPMSEYLAFPGVEAAARVGRYDAQARVGDRNTQGVYIGVDRADFIQAAFWRSDFANTHAGELMNALAQSPEAVLVSHQFARANGLRPGDYIRIEVKLPEGRLELNAQIVGFFDYFPTWYEEDDGALFVGNLETLFLQTGGDLPYEVWLRTTGAPDTAALDDALTERNLLTWRFDEPYTAIAAEQSRPERQGMFGLLSVGFVASALLTVLGFFMYFLFSFRRRMVSLGILRAVGLSSKQMRLFVAFEMAFLILCGLTLGTGLGAVINRLFIPYLQIGNSTASNVFTASAAATPPYLVELAWQAVFQIYVLFALLFIAALFVLAALLRRMNIFEAIKLGEIV
jgi:putative ABC transport system permease protein